MARDVRCSVWPELDHVSMCLPLELKGRPTHGTWNGKVEIPQRKISMLFPEERKMNAVPTK
jgi:hypothetical protein